MRPPWFWCRFLDSQTFLKLLVVLSFFGCLLNMILPHEMMSKCSYHHVHHDEKNNQLPLPKSHIYIYINCKYHHIIKNHAVAVFVVVANMLNTPFSFSFFILTASRLANFAFNFSISAFFASTVVVVVVVAGGVDLSTDC